MPFREALDPRRLEIFDGINESVKDPLRNLECDFFFCISFASPSTEATDGELGVAKVELRF